MPFKSTKAKVLPRSKPKPRVNYNKRYLECRVEVVTTMKPDGNGGEKLRYHTGEFIKTLKTVSIEPKRASQLNRSWESRKMMYWPESEPQPKLLRRVPVEDADGNPEWRNEMKMLGADDEEWVVFEI